MIGILILGAVGCAFGFLCPLKRTDYNLHELMLIFNLQALFTASWYTTSNSIAVNTLVGIAVVQFIIFILYQRKFYRKFNNVLCIAELFAKLKLKKISNLFEKKSAKVENILELQNPTPEVAYNYKEYQEPLIGHD